MLITVTELDLAGSAEGTPLVGAGEEPGAAFADLLGTAMQSVMIISLLLLLLYFIWGAIDWITSAGDKGKIETARNKMMHAAIGIVVLASVVALYLAVQYVLGLNVLSFS